MGLRYIRIVTFLWTACIVIATLARGSQMGQHLRTIGTFHVAVHFCIFAVFGVLLISSLSRNSVRLHILAIVVGIALGASAEVYEHLAFGNEIEFADVVTNTLGNLLGFVVGEMLQRRARG